MLQKLLVATLVFIKDLINTYDDFKSYTLIKNDKTNDLSKIYGEYEKIILSNNLSNFYYL